MRLALAPARLVTRPFRSRRGAPLPRLMPRRFVVPHRLTALCKNVGEAEATITELRRRITAFVDSLHADPAFQSLFGPQDATTQALDAALGVQDQTIHQAPGDVIRRAKNTRKES